MKKNYPNDNDIDIIWLRKLVKASNEDSVTQESLTERTDDFMLNASGSFSV